MVTSLRGALRRLTARSPLRRHGEPAMSDPETRFVIFCQGRTGSSLLRSLLNSHPAVRCEGEILADPVADPLKFLEETARSSAKPVFGFKVKIYQLADAQNVDPQEFLGDLRDRSYRIVYLRRNNLLRHAISNTFAEARRSYHDRSAGPRPSLTVDPGQIIGVMQRRQKHLENEAAVLEGFDFLTVDYEKDLLDPMQHQSTADRVFTFLGIEPAAVETDLSRSVSGSLSERIANYDELAAALEDTEFSRFLTDPSYG
jgi:LPS sulfotransferase NodH